MQRCINLFALDNSRQYEECRPVVDCWSLGRKNNTSINPDMHCTLSIGTNWLYPNLKYALVQQRAHYTRYGLMLRARYLMANWTSLLTPIDAIAAVLCVHSIRLRATCVGKYKYGGRVHGTRERQLWANITIGAYQRARHSVESWFKWCFYVSRPRCRHRHRFALPLYCATEPFTRHLVYLAGVESRFNQEKKIVGRRSIRRAKRVLNGEQ